jgi:hypothetical protein
MTKEEVSTAVAWAAREGWNPGLADAEYFYTAYTGGFFCAELDGKIVGTISVVNYDDRFSFYGFFVVNPAYRARGIMVLHNWTAMGRLPSMGCEGSARRVTRSARSLPKTG